jgi:hypothetical protein
VHRDALVEALEARGEQRQPLLARKLLDDVLGQLPALRGERDDTVVRRSAVDRFQRRGDDVHAQHHAGAASVGLVVHLAGVERCVVPVVEETQLQLVSEHGRNRPLLREPGERVREESKDVELHRNGRMAG